MSDKPAGCWSREFLHNALTHGAIACVMGKNDIFLVCVGAEQASALVRALCVIYDCSLLLSGMAPKQHARDTMRVRVVHGTNSIDCV